MDRIYVTEGSWWSLILVAVPIGFWLYLNRLDVLRIIRDRLIELRWKVFRR